MLASFPFHHHQGLLAGAFNPGAAEGVMCRETVSIGWDGRVYDCDFNQQLDMAMKLVQSPFYVNSGEEGELSGPTSSSSPSLGAKGVTAAGAGAAAPLTVHDLRSLDELTGRRIELGAHCYGCTAGSGSSCTGAVL